HPQESSSLVALSVPQAKHELHRWTCARAAAAVENKAKVSSRTRRIIRREAASYLFGAPGGWSLWNTSRFFATYDSQLGGTSLSMKIAVTGHSGTHAPQSMHSAGWM